MKQEEIKIKLNHILDDVKRQGEIINEHFDEKAIIRFKKELKIIRLFMGFVRTHKGERGMRMPEKIKKLYNITGSICEMIDPENVAESSPVAGPDEREWSQLIELAKTEWKKNYTIALLEKFQKQLLDYNYGGIPPELIDNFFSSQARVVEKMSAF